MYCTDVLVKYKLDLQLNCHMTNLVSPYQIIQEIKSFTVSNTRRSIIILIFTKLGNLATASKLVASKRLQREKQQ